MCGSLVAEEPELLPDVLFGAACSLAMDGVAAGHLLGAWEAGRSALRREPALRRLTRQASASAAPRAGSARPGAAGSARWARRSPTACASRRRRA